VRIQPLQKAHLFTGSSKKCNQCAATTKAKILIFAAHSSLAHSDLPEGRCSGGILERN
jgi:hypothetical protein